MHGGEMIGTEELEKLRNSKRVDVLYNGIDLKQFYQVISENERKIIREEYGLKPNDFVLVFCGRLIPEKGVKEIILAMKKLKNINNVKLLIIGNSAFGKNEKTKYQEELYKISKDLINNIIFTGFIHNKDLYKIYNIADAAITPSIWEEASPLVIVEEMASGLPIITTDSGGIPELVNFDSAIILKRDESLVENIARNIELLIVDENRRTRMSIERKRKKQGVF